MRGDPGGYPADGTFCVRFVLGMSYTSRKNGEVVMLCQFVIRRVEHRCIPVALSMVDRCCTVVGHQDRSHTAEEFEHMDVGFDPVTGPLV